MRYFQFKGERMELFAQIYAPHQGQARLNTLIPAFQPCLADWQPPLPLHLKCEYIKFRVFCIYHNKSSPLCSHKCYKAGEAGSIFLYMGRKFSLIQYNLLSFKLGNQHSRSRKHSRSNPPFPALRSSPKPQLQEIWALSSSTQGRH